MEEITPDEVSLASSLIDDPLDRPIFIYAKRFIESNEDTYFVTGDKGFFKEKVIEIIPKRIIHTTEAIDIINNDRDRSESPPNKVSFINHKGH